MRKEKIKKTPINSKGILLISSKVVSFFSIQNLCEKIDNKSLGNNKNKVQFTKHCPKTRLLLFGSAVVF